MRNKRILILLGIFLSGCVNGVVLPTPSKIESKPSTNISASSTISNNTNQSTNITAEVKVSTSSDIKDGNLTSQNTTITPTPSIAPSTIYTSPTPSISVIDPTVPISESDRLNSKPGGNPCNTVDFGPICPYKYVEVNVFPIPENKTSGTISMAFKDEYKIRYNKTENRFYSLIGQDTTEINNFFNQYNVSVLPSTDPTEEAANLTEISGEKSCKCDYRHPLSLYTLKFTNIMNLKDFVLKLRANILVREANVDSYDSDAPLNQERG